MRLLVHVLALVSAVFAADAWYPGGGGGGGSQPSSTPWTGYLCPDTDNYGHGKAPWGCDSPPYPNSMFGCTYRTGSGVGTYPCEYYVHDGQGPSGQDSRCPSSAAYHNGRKKRSPPSVAAPVPADSYVNRNIIRGSREAAKFV
ncbi:uncharacterized protein EV420DRAFT_513459 [Desarmillaria tabescens]|uniref:Secreted protein n=1 Tax=Armillaria tabescens TaxID=1929756 RepID=A0AA39N4J9_ARMTA|nr:uncharacterized protein EV420DRAFT_513459 [Desarmillaria tabescens]KAK0457218.1 hypothetical protein EV420DRAFT_513459 [Desarmillaria tabescens]